ncbi:MAG: IS3 family transposase [Pirellulales bacterium]
MESIVESNVASEREVCDSLGCSRKAYQRWKNVGSAPVREADDQALMPKVTSIFHKHRRRYGTRRIVKELRDHQCHVSRRRVGKLLKIAGLSAIQPKSFKPRSTESRHTLGYNPNLILDLAEPCRTNQLWVGDITYILLALKGFFYLATLMDRYSRRIIGWALEEDMTESLAITGLRRAIAERQPRPDLIHHTDRGGQYASVRYRKMLSRAAMRQSMSRAGDCYDNAFMESCFGTIKTELQMTDYPTYRAAIKDLSEYIQYYNTERKHSAIGYVTPSQFEAAHGHRR